MGNDTIHFASTILSGKPLLQQMVESLGGEGHRDLLRFELGIQFAQLFLKDERRHFLVHIAEDDGARQAIEKLGLEGPLHLFHHRLTTTDAAIETNALTCKLCSSIGRHDEHDVAEIGLTSFVVGQSGIVHHLQQDVVDVLMGFLNLVEQQHGIGRLADGIGQQTTVLVAHIARRRSDELGDGMFLGVFAHVEAYQFDTQFPGQYARHLRLAHARRADEEQRGQRFVVVQQSCARHLHSLNDLTNGLVLTVNL